ncbi:MBL fold metallo-hydrolase [Mesorhizobium sp. IMUNJ 23232]|uniref:MBL fold metallo-hydrolase n=1 Tax=Mesorhizobium sp. IMUNJ 23232 TaxID=3376064 RepID=UPI0037B38C3D
MTKHLRVLHPAKGILAFYDGRVDGYRFAAGLNWVDDGALSLGIASYAIVEGDEALVYDTHVSVDHARFVRNTLEALGVSKFTVVLSHWHLDHVAGTAAFADCEIIANRRTAAHLASRKAAIEAGTLEGPPAIDPLILPTKLFDDHLSLKIGNRAIELIELNVHSDDATVLWLPERRLLLAGDTLEDTVTYVGEPENFDRHLEDLVKLSALDPASILPNHGDPDIITGGGYAKTLIAATEDYIRALQRAVDEPSLRELTLKEFVAPQLDAGWIRYFAPYEDVHRNNVAAVLSAAQAERQ